MGDVVDDIYKPKAAQASKFAEYEEVAVNINPQVADYTVSQGLTNVINADDFVFSQDAEDLFVKNGFVVIPAKYDEFFSVYEMNRYADTPNFITTDSILHNYHLMFNYLLKNLEEEKLTYELQDLNEAMLGAAMEQYESLAGTEWENAAKRNVAFFSVGSVLLDEDVEIPQIVQDEVDEELNLIEAHAGITLSPVMNLGADADILDGLKEDYSQYIPRGHYDQSDELKAYFKTMMWYGRLTFRFKNEDEVKSAILITLALSDDDSKALWERIYEPTNFFVGKSDDISCYDFEDLVEQIYGKMDIDAVTGDATKFASFVASAKELEPPQINSMPIFNYDIQPDREAEIEGFRFMGQRFTIDASIFQRLVDREVKDRMLPKGLDITAAMGSDEALDILEGMGETDYEDYSDNMSKMKKYVADLTADTWTQNLYWGWLHSLLPLVEEKSAGYPSFMRNLAWVRKELNTYLGSWAELKHDTILYAKQVYAELGGGPREEVDDRGYVEPNPYVYARLASLIKMTKEGLEIRDLLSSDNKNTLELMEELVLSLKTISEKELNNQSLTDDEYELIRSYGGQLEHFWIEALRSEGVTSTAQLSEHPAAIVADVATDPNGFVLEEGIGHINEIYAVVPIDGELRVVKGGVFSYYEFSWPLADRLTDSAWRELLDSDEAPALPEWTSVFTEQ
ncbi:DUF3160 domain-containing protein [Patescibacteria group bacterium]|nr:DUF3160 domain-containing protein [Patescibacteria group bacterium]